MFDRSIVFPISTVQEVQLSNNFIIFQLYVLIDDAFNKDLFSYANLDFDVMIQSN